MEKLRVLDLNQFQKDISEFGQKIRNYNNYGQFVTDSDWNTPARVDVRTCSYQSGWGNYPCFKDVTVYVNRFGQEVGQFDIEGTFRSGSGIKEQVKTINSGSAFENAGSPMTDPRLVENALRGFKDVSPRK
jgi:hypothetical protein